MAKGAYIGVDGKARKVKKIYIGVGNVAKKVKKAYIGVGGVARLCYQLAPNVVFDKSIDFGSSYKNLYHVVGARIGEYAVFGGGYLSPGSSKNNMYAYNNSGTSVTISSLQKARYTMSAARAGSSYVIFGPGNDGYGNYAPQLDAYNASLTRSAPSTGFNLPAESYAAATAGNYAIFAGGRSSEGARAYAWAFDTSLTRSKPSSDLPVISCYLAAGSVGNYAVFGGGYCYTPYDDGIESKILNNVTAYNSSLQRVTATVLNAESEYLAAGSNGNYVIFAGGYNWTSSRLANANAYNASLTRTIPTALSSARQDHAGGSIGTNAIFGGGQGKSSLLNSTEIYNESLTRSDGPNLSGNRTNVSAVSNEKYVFFPFGGQQTIDVFKLS